MRRSRAQNAFDFFERGATVGDFQRIAAEAPRLGLDDIVASPLNVGGAFHTPLMQSAADALPNACVISSIVPCTITFGVSYFSFIFFSFSENLNPWSR